MASAAALRGTVRYRRLKMYEFKQNASQKNKNLNMLSDEQRLLWEERVAICIIDGGVSQERAEQIAWEEIERSENA
jgi:hypothetical protein